MRISDWSSDVCSSDLLTVRLASDEDSRLCAAFGTWVEKQNYGRTYMGIERSTFQIGRASCRERVVSVHVDLGGRRIIKKKNEKQDHKKIQLMIIFTTISDIKHHNTNINQIK